MAWRLVRPLLFRLSPETAHNLALTGATRGARFLRTPAVARDPRLAQNLIGLEFRNPVGLAAGLDKFGSATAAWPRVGFGFAEIGSITAHPQPGNPAPRMFRLPADRALINRMGFNNDGAAVTAGRLVAARQHGKLGEIPTGINLGKSKVTPTERAPGDYVASLEALWPVADYVVVNVSSPNTPGLRDLQESSALASVLRELIAVNMRRSVRDQATMRPILVKIAPDLTDSQVDAVVDLALELEVEGVVVSNTTIGRAGLRSAPDLAAETGGLSGAPVRERSTALVRRVAERARGRLVIIGVGGVSSADHAWEKIVAGASLIQLYTALVYEGPGLVPRICEGLVDRLDRAGLNSIESAVGADLGGASWS